MADQKDLFSRLKKMFSTDVIVRNVGGKKIKVVDTDEIQYATDRNSLRDRFNRLRSSTYNLHNRDLSMAYQSSRLELFRDYDVMDMDPIIASALDIYSDECLVPSEFGNVLTIRSKNENIKRILHNLFYDIMNVEFNMWSWTRNMCKYGDFFLRMEISPEYGVYLVHPISPYEITRIEGSDPKNINYVKYQHDGVGGGMEYENFEIAHFRLLSDSNFLPYGKSMVEPARRVWKQLSLMEDAMLIHRIMRAPEKRIFSIDVGNIPPADIDTAMQKIISQVKKVPYIDEKTGDYNLRFNLNNMIEDFYLPVRGSDSGTKIDTLPGMEFTGIDDLEYIRNKMMAALKIPKAFLGYEEGLSGKATLAAEDVRFARTIGRIQRILISELTKIAIVHLYVQGYQDASLVDFELELSNPSTIFEQEKLEIWQNKINLASDMKDSNMFSKTWMYNNIFNMSDVDMKHCRMRLLVIKKKNGDCNKLLMRAAILRLQLVEVKVLLVEVVQHLNLVAVKAVGRRLVEKLVDCLRLKKNRKPTKPLLTKKQEKIVTVEIAIKQETRKNIHLRTPKTLGKILLVTKKTKKNQKQNAELVIYTEALDCL